VDDVGFFDAGQAGVEASERISEAVVVDTQDVSAML
jgi:hypothetical protein